MIKQLLIVVIPFVVGLYFLPSAFTGTLPPQSLELRPLASGPNPVDKTLQKWLESYVAQSPVTELDDRDFSKFVAKKDRVTQLFLGLRRANRSGNFSEKVLKDAVDLLQKTDGALAVGTKQHPLKPYFLEELMQAATLPQEVSDFVIGLLKDEGGRSCPHKELLQREITPELLVTYQQEQHVRLLTQIGAFRSRKFREDAFKRYIDSLTSEQRNLVMGALLPIIKEFPKLAEGQEWLLREELYDGVAGDQALSPAMTLYQAARGSIRQRRCDTARQQLRSGLTVDTNASHFTEVEAVSEILAGCYRRRSQQARLDFWRQIESDLKKTYGFDGVELAQRRQGLIHWSADRFNQTYPIFEGLLQESENQKRRDLAANTLYLLARIAKNEGNLSRAIGYYRLYVENYSDQEHKLDTLMALVLLNAGNGDSLQALSYARQIIDDQTMLDIDDRNGAASSFALFWAGRLSVILDEAEGAKHYWRRVASEHYSTFYGAMGHYMYEQLTGMTYRLEPSRTRPLRFEQLLRRFDYDDQLTIRRAKTLLSLGFRSEARCEVAELDVSDGVHDKILVNSMILYATGDWLAAIRQFNSLPDSYRHQLPSGFERMLFPIAFRETVENYSLKLGVDPDIVLAIIRQESVFNPRAHSGAGARGVMQLMPATARLEAGQLRRNYLDAADRRRIQRDVGRITNLFDPDLNIALGVHHFDRLLRMYKNPIYVLTSYNANPRATERWINNLPTDDFLIFIEQIPYQETRLYVKLVLRNYFYYKRWYRGVEDPLPYLSPLLSHDLKRVASLLESKDALPPRPSRG